MLDGIKPVNETPMPTVPAEPVVETVVEPVDVPVVETPVEVVAPTEPIVPAVDPTIEPVKPSYEYTPSGNEFFDSAAVVAIESGLNPTVLAETIKTTGDISSTDRAVLISKIGEAHTNMLINGFKSEVASLESKANEAAAAVHTTVGGVEMWDAIVAWTQSDASGLTEAGEKEYNAMLNAGGVQAQLAAKALKEQYMSSPGFKEAHPTIVTPDAIVPATPTTEPISRRQYTEDMQKATRTANMVEIKSLDARARFTMENHPDQWRPRVTGY